MNYSNGFDMDVVQSALQGRIGWRSRNDDSASGRYYEDFHALCQAPLLKDAQITVGISDSVFDDFLSSLKSAVLSRALNGVLNETEYIEECYIQDRVVNSQDFAIQNANNFVGYRIKVAKTFDIAVWVRTVSLLFDSVKTFNLYLFKEGIQQPLQTFSVTTKAGDLAFIDLKDTQGSDLVLSYSAGKGDVFYFGYFQNDLGSTKALNEVVTRNTTLSFEAVPVIAAATGATSFNQRYVTWTYFPYGLNLQIASFRDYTGLIKKNAFLFDELQGLCMAYTVLDHLRLATRSNPTERKTKEVLDPLTIQMEMQGAAPISDGPKIKGLAERIDREIIRVKQSFYPKQKAASFTYADCD